jgi:hypothetical protein
VIGVAVALDLVVVGVANLELAGQLFATEQELERGVDLRLPAPRS